VKSVQRCVALSQLLTEQNFPAIGIHRGMTQEERLNRYQQFKDFQKRIPRLQQLGLEDVLDVGGLACDRVPGGLHLDGEAGVLRLQVAHPVNVGGQAIVQVLQLHLLGHARVPGGAEGAGGRLRVSGRRRRLRTRRWRPGGGGVAGLRRGGASTSGFARHVHAARQMKCAE